MSAADALARGVCALGLPAAVRATVARRRASILLYHDPAPEVLESHLRYLGPRYAFVPLERIVDAVHARDFSGLPRRALAVTFDDGHLANARLGDVLRRHGARATIYLCSQIVGTSRHYWFMDVDDPEPLKALPNDERLARLAARGFDQAASHAPGARQAMSRDELAELRDTVDFGGHTRFHPILPACDEATARSEIAGCREEVAELTGAPCRDFAYPNGDFTDRDVRLVREAGFRSARTTRIGWVGPRSDPFRLPILGVPDDASVDRLAADLTGVTSLLARHWTGRGFRLRGR